MSELHPIDRTAMNAIEHTQERGQLVVHMAVSWRMVSRVYEHFGKFRSFSDAGRRLIINAELNKRGLVREPAPRQQLSPALRALLTRPAVIRGE